MRDGNEDIETAGPSRSEEETEGDFEGGLKEAACSTWSAIVSCHLCGGANFYYHGNSLGNRLQ